MESNIRHVWGSMIIASVSLGCSSPLGSDPVESVTHPIAGQISCETGVAATTHRRFKYTGASVTQVVCKPEGLSVPEVVTIDDNTGAAVSFEDELDADRAAFQGWNGKLEPDVRAMLEKAPHSLEEFYVWFHVDESDAPPKEWLVADVAAATGEMASHDARTRVGAQALVAKLEVVGGVKVVSDVSPKEEYGIPVVRVRAALPDLDQIASWPEVWRIDRVPKDDELSPTYETYYYTTLESSADLWGFDGTGVTVAAAESVRPDSWTYLSGAPAGNCYDEFGQGRKCHCPTGPGPFVDSHMRETMGIVRRSSGSTLGMANDATTIAANFGGNCTSNGPDGVASAMNWATSNGASVIFHSQCTGIGPSQTAHDMFFDYKNSTWPFPFIAHAGGNWDNCGSGQIVCNKSRNGVVVGGANEYPGSSDRSLVTVESTACYRNGTSFTTDPEWPHLVGIYTGDSAGHDPQNPISYNLSGTSLSAPMVAGIVASLQELNPSLKYWPEAVFPGLLASANEDTDGATFNLQDPYDDRDGAGLVNAWEAALVLQPSSKVDGGNAPVGHGHDYGTMYASSTPANTWYSEVYTARVAAGKQLRICVFHQSRVNCPQNPGVDSCTADPVPYAGLYIWEGQNYLTMSNDGRDNYEYVALTNSSGVQKDYTMKIYLQAWNGLAATTWGIAWSSP